jgi:hypothetical protein
LDLYCFSPYVGQFWSRIGVIDSRYFLPLIVQFHSIRDLNLAYCNFLTGSVLLEFVDHIANYGEIERINLFYCYQLQDQEIIQLISKTPKLREFNIGRVVNLTDATMNALANLQYLRSLNVIYNGQIDEETLMLFDDSSKFPNLHTLNVVQCAKYLEKPELIEELKNTRPHLKIIGPQEIFTTDKNGKKLRRDVQDT